MKRLFTLILSTLAVLGIEAQEVKLDITNALWATYYVTTGLDLSKNTNLAFFKVSEIKTTSVVLSRIYSAAEGDMIMAHGQEGTYTLTKDDNAAAVTGNLLKGNNEEVVSDGTYYGLKEVYQQVAFYHVDAGTTIPAGKGYLIVPYGTNSGYSLELDPAGITDVQTQSEVPVFYNLQGVRVELPTRGVYIVNGKKVVLK